MSGQKVAEADPDNYYGSLDDHIDIAMRSALAIPEDISATKRKNPKEDVFTPTALAKVARSVVYQLAIDNDSTGEYRYEELLADSIVHFTNVTINEKHLRMLAAVIKDLIQPALVRRDDSYTDFLAQEEDDHLDDTELVDQIGAEEEAPQMSAEKAGATTEIRRRRQIPITDSITTTSNNSDLAREHAEFDVWMDKVMADSEAQYLAEEPDYADAESSAKASAYRVDAPAKAEHKGGRDDEESAEEDSVQAVRRLPDCKNASSSGDESPDDDTLHSQGSVERRTQGAKGIEVFASPEPYQVRKSAHSSGEREGSGAVEGEPLPAWYMPKSPLDSHFCKGYGGLGKPNLDEVIHEVTSSQKKALRESRIRDDHEVASDSDTQRSDVPSDAGSEHTDTAAMDEPLPAWAMPKSPLDAEFRRGYGGLGHQDLDEAVEEISTAQKKARAAVRDHKRRMEAKLGRLYSDSESDSDRDAELRALAAGGLESDTEFDVLQENIITVDDLPDDFGVTSTAFNPTTVGTPEQRARPSRENTGSADGNRSRGSEYAKQTKLFQSPNPSRMRVTVSAKKSGSKESVKVSEDTAPAWEMPKSPLDSEFRRGYGGLGHQDLDEAVEEITTAQKKARSQQPRLTRRVGDKSKDSSVIKMLDQWFDTKRVKEKKVAPSTAGSRGAAKMKPKANGAPRPCSKPSSKTAAAKSAPKTRVAAKRKASSGNVAPTHGADASEQIMFDDEPSSFIDHHGDGLAGDDGDGDHLLPEAHTASEATAGRGASSAPLTGNAELNRMIQESFEATVAQYTQGETSRPTHPVASAQKVPAKSPSNSTPGSAKKRPASAPDVDAYLLSPHLQHSMTEIERMISANLNKLAKMRAQEQATRDSFSSGVSLTDGSAERPTKRTITRTRPTKRPASAGSGAVRKAPNAPSAPRAAPRPAVPAKKGKKVLARCKSTTTLHLRGTGHVKAPTGAPLPNVASRRSSQSTASAGALPATTSVPKSYSSRISVQLLSLHSRPTASSGARATTPATRRSTTPPASTAARPLSAASRLLAPTVSALIRAADIATNSSKDANIQNEWHLRLRQGEGDEEGGVEASERKLRNSMIRRSLPDGDGEHIIEWSSPDRKSKSMDLSLGVRNHALYVLDSSALDAVSPFSTPQRSPVRPRRKDPVYIAPLPRGSRLAEPTVATVMRSLDAAEQSPVIKRLQKELHSQPSKAYLFRGPKFAQNLALFQAQPPKRKRKGKRRRGSKTSTQT